MKQIKITAMTVYVTDIPVRLMRRHGSGDVAGSVKNAILKLETDAGITGKVGEPKITNNSIEVFTDRIQLILRSPLNRLQDLVSTSWKFIGDWPVRTDATTGDAARFKRFAVVMSGE